MFKEFKKFAMRGNMIDLAVGIIVGGAFNKIVTSLVTDIISPIVGLLLGRIELTKIVIPIGNLVSLHVGLFLQAVLDFLIIAFSVFMMVKGINSFRRKQEKEVEAAPAISKEELLLQEIRDILRQKSL